MSNIPVIIGKLIRVCPGRRRACFESNIGPLQKPINPDGTIRTRGEADCYLLRQAADKANISPTHFKRLAEEQEPKILPHEGLVAGHFAYTPEQVEQVKQRRKRL